MSQSRARAQRAIRPVPSTEGHTAWTAQMDDRAPNSATATCPYCGTAVRPGDEERCPQKLIRQAAEELEGNP